MSNNYPLGSKSQARLSSTLLPSEISIDEIRKCAHSGELGSDFQLSFPSSVSPSLPSSPSFCCSSEQDETRTCRDLNGRAREDGSEGSPLPCLSYNNSIENISKSATAKEKQEFIYSTLKLLSPYHKKQAETLHLNVKRVVDLAPTVGHIGFLTLTFKDNVTDHKEAYKRFRSMNTNFLFKSPLFGEWVCVKERQKRGAWHYHLIVQLSEDIRTGFDFKQYGKACQLKYFNVPYLSPLNAPYRKEMKKAMRSVPPYLFGIWRTLREELPKYGFGRSELLPVLSNEDGLARYIGKYIGKHMGERQRSDKGVRLVNYSKNWVKNSPKFQWYSENTQKWRKNLKMFVNRYGGGSQNEDEAMLKMKMLYGPHWLFNLAPHIMQFDQVVAEEQTEIPF